MKHILVLAYAISPFKGSEFSVAWNYLVQMSKNNKITVFYGVSDDHMGDNQTMEKYLKTNSHDNIHFVFVKPTILASTFNYFNKKNIIHYFFYFAYFFWQKEVFRKVNLFLKTNRVDLIHFLNPIGFREPGFLWKIDKPYIWGPIGGVNNLPFNGLKFLSSKGKYKLIIRSLINSYQRRFSKRLKKALNSVDYLLTATSESQNFFKKTHNIKSFYIPENGIIGDVTINKNKFSIKEKIKLIWIGSIEDRKALIILLKTIKKLSYRNDFIVNIVGDGPLKNQMIKYSLNNNLEEFIIWHGNVDRSEVIKLINNAHLNVITSLSEGNPTTIWECMSKGVPTITLDHCGMKDTICDKCGIKVTMSPKTDLVNELYNEILKVLESPKLLFHLSIGVIDCAEKFKWEKRIKIFNNIYEESIQRWRLKKNQ